MTKLFIVISYVNSHPGATFKEVQAALRKEVNKNTVDNYLSSFYGYTVGNGHSGDIESFRKRPEYVKIEYEKVNGRRVRKYYVTQEGKDFIEFELSKHTNLNF